MQNLLCREYCLIHDVERVMIFHFFFQRRRRDLLNNLTINNCDKVENFKKLKTISVKSLKIYDDVSTFAWRRSRNVETSSYIFKLLTEMVFNFLKFSTLSQFFIVKFFFRWRFYTALWNPYRVLIDNRSRTDTKTFSVCSFPGGGVLPIMAYTGSLRPKGVPLSAFRYIKG